MNYKIIKMFTEKLNLIFFSKFIETDKIELVVNLHTSLIAEEDEKTFLLKINYSIDTKNAPISLDWVGVCVLESDDKFLSEINSDELLDNDKIKNFLDETIKNLSFFINGNLPKIEDIRGASKKDD